VGVRNIKYVSNNDCTVVEYKLTVLCFFFDIFYIMNKIIVI
jgi:hypothetical protein